MAGLVPAPAPVAPRKRRTTSTRKCVCVGVGDDVTIVRSVAAVGALSTIKGITRVEDCVRRGTAHDVRPPDGEGPRDDAQPEEMCTRQAVPTSTYRLSCVCALAEKANGRAPGLELRSLHRPHEEQRDVHRVQDAVGREELQQPLHRADGAHELAQVRAAVGEAHEPDVGVDVLVDAVPARARHTRC